MEGQRKDDQYIAQKADEFLMEPPDDPFRLFLTLKVNHSFESNKRFDLLKPAADGARARYRSWDKTGDQERMEAYYQNLEGIEKLRERYKPREWEPTLQEAWYLLPLAPVEQLIKKLSNTRVAFPVNQDHFGILDGVHITLTTQDWRGELQVRWCEGGNSELDDLVRHIKALFSDAHRVDLPSAHEE